MKIKLFLLNYIIKEKQYYMRVDVLLILTIVLLSTINCCTWVPCVRRSMAF